MGRTANRTRASNYFRRGSAGLIQILAYLMGIAALAAVLFTTAPFIDSPSIVIALGLLAAAIVIALISRLSAHFLERSFKWKYSITQSIGATSILFVGISLILLRSLVPISDQFTVVTPDGVEFWELPTGSTIAVRKFSATGPIKGEPIIFVHGGPGAYSVALEQTVKPISKLSHSGHDVYFYDQVGGGLSERLDDISEYSLDRHISDLRALYEKIGEKKVVLIGSSWGTSLISNYIARNPSHVSRAIFSAAAPIYHPDWQDAGDGGLDDSMTFDEKASFDSAVSKPRLIAAIVWSDLNPKAAAKFLPSREAGSFFDEIANEFYMQFTVCDLNTVSTKTKGYGFWSNRMTGKTLHNRNNDPKPILRKNNIPVLILRGECDYKKEAVAKQYATVFQNSSYISIEDAGHMIYWEKPDAYLDAVRDFLKNE